LTVIGVPKAPDQESVPAPQSNVAAEAFRSSRQSLPSGGGGSGGASSNGGRGGASGNGGASGRGGASGSGVLIDGGSDACEMLGNLTFDSIDERECGLAPPDSGAALCHWRITFTNGTTFTWRHSDYVESGTYSCSDNTITAQTQTRGSLTSTLNLWRFTWDGVVYICNGCPP